MAKIKYDGVIVAARYTAEGQIAWVRAYERRGPTFSDHVNIRREALLEKLEAGKIFVTGNRREFEASNFEIGRAVHVHEHHGRELLVTEGTRNAEKDTLENVPAV